MEMRCQQHLTVPMEFMRGAPKSRFLQSALSLVPTLLQIAVLRWHRIWPVPLQILAVQEMFLSRLSPIAKQRSHTAQLRISSTKLLVSDPSIYMLTKFRLFFSSNHISARTYSSGRIVLLNTSYQNKRVVNEDIRKRCCSSLIEIVGEPLPMPACSNA